MRRIFLLMLLFWQLPVWAQTVLQPAPTVPTTVPRDSFIRFEPRVKYIFPELKDSATVNALKKKADGCYSYLKKAPLKFNDLTFFNYNLVRFEQRKNMLKTGDYDFFNVLFDPRDSNWLYGRSNIYPPSLRYYADTSGMKVDKRTGEIVVNEMPVLDRYIEPFYFRNYEVTNAEYREFMRWVTDSIVKEMLIKGGFKDYGIYPDSSDSTVHRINWKKKIRWDDEDEYYRSVLEDIYLPVRERFYYLKQVDTRKLNYAWYPDEEERQYYSYKPKKEVSNIAPDTVSWVNDFDDFGAEMMMDDYFWHPSYDQYPVVGITMEHVLAYLHWKTIQMQQELDRKGIKYRVKCKLPSEIEWDIVTTAGISEDTIRTFNNASSYLMDESWLTDLRLVPRNGGIDTLSRLNSRGKSTINYSMVRMDKLLLKDENFVGYNMADGREYTAIADLRLVPKKNASQIMINLDPIGISGMGSSVSEWMDNTMDGSWRALFLKRQELLMGSKFKEAQLVAQVEQFYYMFNYDPSKSKYDKGFPVNNARLIRGGNWFDERYSFKKDKNSAGMNAKCFMEDTGYVTHCTIGFRYIVKVYPK